MTREVRAPIEGALKMQLAYQSRVERGSTRRTNRALPASRQPEQLMIAYLNYTYRMEHFDAPLLARRFDSIEHDIIVLDNQRPCIAVSSLFSMDEVRKKDDIVRAVLNVLAVDARRTLAIFFDTSEDGPTARVALDRILLSKGDYGAGDAACGD